MLIPDIKMQSVFLPKPLIISSIGGIFSGFLLRPSFIRSDGRYMFYDAISQLFRKKCVKKASKAALYDKFMISTGRYGCENQEEPSSDFCNCLIRDYCKVGNVDAAMSVLAHMEAVGLRSSVASYAYVIEALGNVGRTLEADIIFQEMISLGCKPRASVCNALLRGFLRKGLLDLASGVLVLMSDLDIQRNQETYELLLDYHSNAGRLEDTWSIINEMKLKGFQLNSFVYSKVIVIYQNNGMWKKAVGIVDEIRKSGISMDIHIYNSIIDTFGKYGQLSEALEVFRRMQQDGVIPDITTWNSLIQWNFKAGNLATALELFTEMQEQGMHPDPKIFITLISSLGEQGKWDVIKKNLDSMKLRGHKNSGLVYEILVDIYGQYGQFQDAEKCISALKYEGLLPSASIFCIMANAYAQQGLCEETVKVLQLMEEEGIEPNLVMLNVLINAFAVAGYQSGCYYLHHPYEGIYSSKEVS
ncbi:pentatricopeptide repeat-containing protein At5g42310, mitochondrial-like isoform X2 [Momordica charantia]|uniref:Pentatricopeptide repeat-containing protein At5g42310, mitochondrial-like isoform X2 n=1 Tax=Momordica charantia TaxID=3673 RepID=A0A6J1CH27_MOMCH|nr:pentatricopeptide repeat-containing protein At5g42310, mitochondrial-like isoform X2 [Momordica charantia]